MPLIFLSYRRHDSQGITRRIRDALVKEYGEDTIFLDETSIPKGEDIREYIQDVLSQCAVVLPVIASEWLDSILKTSSYGVSWLRPNDWVRLEIEESLKCVGVKVVPILIDEVKMPRAELLPETLQDLVYRNGFPFSTKAFNEDIPRLIRELDRLIDGTVRALPENLPKPTDDEIVRREQYRHEVQYCLENNDGKLDSISKIYLDKLQQHLGLTFLEAKSMQEACLRSYTYYEEAVTDLVRRKMRQHEKQSSEGERIERLVPTLDRRSINHLRRLQHNLDLPRWKAIKIEHQALNDEYYQRLRQYLWRKNKDNSAQAKIEEILLRIPKN